MIMHATTRPGPGIEAKVPPIPARSAPAFADAIAPQLGDLRAAARRLTRNATDAEDLVSETLLKAFRFFPSFEAGTNLRAWLHRVMFTVFISGKRRPNAEVACPEALAAAPARPISSEGAQPPESISRRAALLDDVDQSVTRAIMSLPADLREAFLLNSVDELKYKEIAQRMSCPIGTVMSRLHRARVLLNSALASWARTEGYLTAA